MIYSKFTQKVSLDEDIYALYNSLLMDVIFVTSEELSQLDSFTLDNSLPIEPEMLSYCKKYGLLVDNENQDKEALQRIRSVYEKQAGKISVAYFLVTSDCNLACRYCFIENPNCDKIELHSMSEKTAITAINKYIDYLHSEGMKEALLIFYGGEPTLNWSVVKAVVDRTTMETDIEFQYTMVTNGTLLDNDKVQYISDHNINLGISIDGPKPINDANRIFKNSAGSVYDTILPKIEMAQRSTHVCLSITLAPSVVAKKNEVLEWLESSPFNSIGFNLYCYTKKDSNWESYSVQATEMIIKAYEKLRTSVFDDRIQRKIDSLREKKFKFTDCGAIGGNQVVFKANGDVCVCHAYEKTDKYTICNINDSDFSSIISSDEFSFWQKRVPIFNEECLACEALFCCGGGCATRAESLFDNREEIDRTFCIHTKMILRWFLKQLCVSN